MKTVRILAAIATVGFLVSCGSKEKTNTSTTSSVVHAKSEKKASTSSSSSNSGAATVTCMNGSDKRTLEIVESKNGCELKYTKMGETKSVANSASGSAHCNTVKDRIVGKLKTAGHKCE